MFWKNVKSIKIQSSSLVTKLITFYSITTMCIVIVVCFILFPSAEQIGHLSDRVTHHDLLSGCIQRLIFALTLSAISSFIFGNWITRKSMNSINEFSDKMQKITVDSLADKINPNDWPKELKTLGKSFNYMLEKLQKSFNQISQFSADIAHELRNPIHNLIGINEMALTKESSSEKYQEILESNMEECRNLLKIIESLWFLARSEHGQINIDREMLSIRIEILKILDYYEPYADENKIEMRCEGDAWAYIDATLFKRAISNLLSNALRYTPPAGKIHIKIESRSDFISITIQDTGIGINEVHLSKLFDRFYRVDVSRSVETGGLGLGLAIVKSIVDLHYGKISINSKVNIGTAVCLHFPVSFPA